MWTARAERFREEARAELDIAYGTRPRESLDLFLPAGAARGLVVIVHGGFWLRFDKSDWSDLAAGSLALGWAVAVPSFPLAPETRLAGIARLIARALELAASRVEGPI
jgi:arylformamidase